MHPLVKIAKDSVEEFVRHGQVLEKPAVSTPEMDAKAGVFVSLKVRGQLRGCIGTFQPSMENVAEEIIQNAISAATRDPRFFPVGEEELALLEYSVDVLSAPEKISSKQGLDPKKYGVIVKSGGRKGLLLPDLEGVDSADEQVNIASMKAGIAAGEPIELYRFEVKRYR